MAMFYPLKLQSVLKDIIWGGTLLSEKYGKGKTGERIAEAWTLSLREDGDNIIENGEFSGKKLSEYAEKVGMASLCGENFAGRNAYDFPLLVKLIDACDKLSVQVHPDDAYAHKNGIDSGKTEMWYIAEAKEGAKLVYGLKDGRDAETLRKAAGDGTLEEHLNFVTVHPGEVYYIPAGLVHAIGAGILIAEIQQNSNTTYRMYDYDRVGKDGKKRELHLDRALEVIKTDFSGDPAFGNTAPKTEKNRISVLADSEFFKTSLLDMDADCEEVDFSSGTMRNLLCLYGGCEVVCGKEKLSLAKGESVLVPAACPAFGLLTKGGAKVILAEAK